MFFTQFAGTEQIAVGEMTNNVDVSTGIPLGELIAFEHLQLTLVTGHESATSSRVSWAHATEMVDPRPHLRGSELVCTVGSTLLSAESCAQFVEAVHATASAGICLGIGEVHTKVPRALITECRRLSVPLVSMSHGVAFVAINDVLADARVTARAGSSARNADLITSLLAELRATTPVATILAIAGGALGGSFELLSGASENSTPAASASTPTTAPTPTPLSVLSADGNLLSWVGPAPAPDSDLLAQIARIVDLAIYETRERDHHSRQRIGHLFELVASGLADAAALMPEFENAGLMAATLTMSAWPAETASILAQHLPDALIADGPEATFVVLTAPELIREVARELGLVCGYSSPITPSQVTRGIAEARAALVLARHNGSVAGPESLTSLTGLLEQQPAGRLVPFIDQLITPIAAVDARRGSQLLETLRTFVDHNGSIQETADARFLHVNTVRHRLATVRKLVGRNPLDHGDLVSLEIALWAFERGQRHNR